MSTSSRVKEELVKILNFEENSQGLTFNQVWGKLEENEELKKELYRETKKGELQKRTGILVGLTTRAREGKNDYGFKVVKNTNGRLVYIANTNIVDYVSKKTSEFVNTVNENKLHRKDDLNKEQQKTMVEFVKLVNQVEKKNEEIKKISEELDKKLIIEEKKKIKKSVKDK